jgi:hypothetical protein
MTLPVRFAVTAVLLLAAAPLAAQSAPVKSSGKTPVKAPAKAPAAPAKPKPAMDHGSMDHAAMHGEQPKSTKPAENHTASGWAELDAYHGFMMATWHPAKGKNDLAPLRAKATDMAVSAKALAESTPPKGCDTPALRAAAKALAPATTDLAVAVAKGATDAELKTALGSLHERFETLESGCSKTPAKKPQP